MLPLSLHLKYHALSRDLPLFHLFAPILFYNCKPNSSVVVNMSFMELNPAKSQFQNFFEHRRSFQGLQHSGSTISPEILKSMIGANSACTESQTQTRSSSPENASVSLPLTIFYNGTVSVFDLPRDKAEMIMRLAQGGNMKNNLVDHKVKMSSDEHDKLMEKLNGDLPIARKKSLQRFLEKRKERMITSSPYAACGSESLVE